uniref:Uncharacterized protein n=1 Tax=Ditylenchus dipsaci TaxID=166011 RepID=A0A915ENX6_9BILA
MKLSELNAEVVKDLVSKVRKSLEVHLQKTDLKKAALEEHKGSTSEHQFKLLKQDSFKYFQKQSKVDVQIEVCENASDSKNNENLKSSQSN